jgi:tRNA A-37 threonylcarbamoyl transferase component Bud32
MKRCVQLEDLAVPGLDSTIKSEPRTVVWRQDLPGGERVVVKLYRRRGRLAAWRGRVARFRTEREYRALDHLGRHDVPCVEPLFWTQGHSAEHGRYEILVTREIPDAVCMRELVAADPKVARRIDLAAIFRGAGRLHHSGLFHGTLWASNILLAPGEGTDLRFYFIDPPRSILFPHGIFGTRMARGDLLDLSYSVGGLLGISGDDLPLGEYGLDEAARSRFLRGLSRYRPGKSRRGLVRGEALVRRFFAGALPGRRGGGSLADGSTE